MGTLFDYFRLLPLETKMGLRLRLILAKNAKSRSFSRCAFDTSGACSEHRRRNDQFGPSFPPPKGTIPCCCSCCAFNVGYFTHQPSNVSIKELESLFNESSGFYRTGHGCALKREHRSSTCLGYTCATIYGTRIFVPSGSVMTRYERLLSMARRAKYSGGA